MLTVAEFAARRRTDQADMEQDLFAHVADAMQHYPAQGWYNDLLKEVARLYVDTYHREGGQGVPKGTATFIDSVRSTLDKTKAPDDNTVNRVSTWLSTAILNAATLEASDSTGEFVVMEWVTMHDEDVRDTHRAADGQQRPPGEMFDVGGAQMPYPGYPGVPIELWINCRCTLAPVAGDLAASVYSVNKEDTMTVTETETETPAVTATPWYGVLAPEEVWSGDGRKFNAGALSHAELPLPLTWQKESNDGHKGSVVVAMIERVARVDNEYRASGHYRLSPEADEAIGLVADFGRFGVSVDADDAEFEFDEDSDKVAFSNARIRSAAMVPIPAFAEAFIALGDAPPGFLPADDECDPTDPNGDCYDPEAVQAPAPAMSAFKDYDAEGRKKAHTVPGTDSYPIEDCQDLANAIQAIGRAKDPAATKAHIKTQKNRLGCPDVSIPEGWDAEVEVFGRGPGWLTNPEDTRRLHDYWTKPGEPGYVKVNWGVPGDFNRCRTEVGQEIAEQDPAKAARFINQICAQWHYDALGYWPGRPTSGDTVAFAEGPPAPALTLVADGGWCAPSEWFTDPCFDALTPLSITDEGRVSGHLAGWKTCHTAYKGVCVSPPHSASGYAYFLTGYVQTDAGPVAVGQITMSETMDGGHARHGPMRPAIAHYDNTCTAVADVTCGEDEHGIWCAGAMRPDATEQQWHTLRACPPSGDWRQVGSDPDNMEMIAALSVNSQGFPIPRVGIENGVQVSLVAAGALTVASSRSVVTAQLVDDVIAEIGRRKTRMTELANRIGGTDGVRV